MIKKIQVENKCLFLFFIDVAILGKLNILVNIDVQTATVILSPLLFEIIGFEILTIFDQNVGQNKTKPYFIISRGKIK